MNTPEGKSEKIPEWGIFSRLDELENLTLELMGKTETTEPTLQRINTKLKDADILARMAFMLAFTHWSTQIEVQNIRKRRDVWLKYLKKLGLTPESLEWTNRIMTIACELREEEG